MLAAERAAWLRLIATPGLGPRTARHLLGHFGLPDQIFATGLLALMRVAPEPLARLLAEPPSAEIQSVIEATEQWLQASAQHKLVSLADPEYPRLLLDTADPPPLLFAIGRPELLARTAVAIVGSRNATQQGIANAEAFAAALARAGATIVSGLALGADTGRVLRQVVREGTAFPIVGLLVGIATALAFSRVLRSSLYEVSPTEPRVFIVTAALLLLASVAACLVPAWRATRSDPMVALRAE